MSKDFHGLAEVRNPVAPILRHLRLLLYGLMFFVEMQNHLVDTENQAIRKIHIDTAMITTIAGRGPAHRGSDGDGGEAFDALLARPHGICVDSTGAIYVGDTLNHRVRRIQGKN